MEVGGILDEEVEEGVSRPRAKTGPELWLCERLALNRSRGASKPRDSNA